MAENYFGITDPGKQRSNNEDSFIAQPVFNKHTILACVIDGVGGYEGGEVAAQLTRDTIIQQLKQPTGDVTGAMIAALETANEKIFKEKALRAQVENMACVVTLALADTEKNRFCYAHVGDTRLYLFRDNNLVKITNDHSAVGFLEESGRLSETAAMQHPKRNEVNKALGYEASISLTKDFIDTGESPFLPGDTILLCSDGLTDMITSSRIIDILGNGSRLKNRAQQLINAANEAGGRDNVTVVLVYNDKSPLKHAVTKPVAVARNVDDNTTTEMISPEVEHNGNEYVTIAPAIEKKKNGDKKIVPVLLLLCIVFFAGFAWFFYQSLQKAKVPKLLMPPVEKKKDTLELNLIKSITDASAGKVISLQAGQSFTITDSIIINRDSLHIKGNGVTISGDTAYKGPAFILSPACTYILLDSFSIAGFNVGVLIHNKGLHLKNVRFINCAVPVQLQQQLPQNEFLSGVQGEAFSYARDSVHK